MGYQKITHTADVYRLTRTGDMESYAVPAVITGLRCGIFPASTDVLAVYPGESSFQLYECYIYKTVTIKNGDKFKSSGDEWIVRGVPQVFNTNYLSYQRVILEKVV
jgi:hypothetical protein